MTYCIRLIKKILGIKNIVFFFLYHHIFIYEKYHRLLLVDRIEQVDKVKPARVLFGFTNFVQYSFSQSGDSFNLGNSFQRDIRIKLRKRFQRDTRVSVVDVFAIGISLKK